MNEFNKKKRIEETYKILDELEEEWSKINNHSTKSQIEQERQITQHYYEKKKRINKNKEK